MAICKSPQHCGTIVCTYRYNTCEYTQYTRTEQNRTEQNRTEHKINWFGGKMPQVRYIYDANTKIHVSRIGYYFHDFESKCIKFSVLFYCDVIRRCPCIHLSKNKAFELCFVQRVMKIYRYNDEFWTRVHFSMAAILNFKMAAPDTTLKMCPLHLLTPKTYI